MATKPNTRPGKGSSLLLPVADYVVVDLETTGFSPAKDDIVELGALRVRDNQVVDTFHSMVNIDRRIPPWVSKKTGIWNNMLYGAPYLPQILPDFMRFVSDDVVLGHNVHFDVNFLYDNTMRLYARHFNNDFMDFVRVAKRLYALPNYQLGTIAAHLDVDASGAHRAVDDCGILHKCYTKGVGSWT